MSYTKRSAGTKRKVDDEYANVGDAYDDEVERRRRVGGAGGIGTGLPLFLLFLLAGVGFGLGLWATIHELNEKERGPMGLNGTCPATCFNGTNGTAGNNGTNGTCLVPCVNGTNGSNGVVGSAMFVQLVQSPNGPGGPAPGTMFTVSNTVYNSAPIAIVSSPGAGGTVFTLATGDYAIDYELSLDQAGSVSLWTGATSGSLVDDTNTIAGSSTATTWIHGRSIINVPGTLVVGLSNHVGSSAVPTAGNAAGFYIVRITIVKLA